jgi:hypothetical protein
MLRPGEEVLYNPSMKVSCPHDGGQTSTENRLYSGGRYHGLFNFPQHAPFGRERTIGHALTERKI